MPQWADAVSHYTTTTASSSRARRFKRLPAKLSATTFVDAERNADSPYGVAQDDDSLSPQRPRSRLTDSITKACRSIMFEVLEDAVAHDGRCLNSS